jgi:tyrosyl-tRNA synthetase
MQSHKNDFLPQDFLQVMKERGFIHQCTDATGLETAMKQPITAYIGFDCTAPSLHVGSLMQIMVLRWLQKCGHKPIVLMGGGTTKVGDPSGKDEARKLLDDAAIEQNMSGIKQVFSKFVDFQEQGGNALMVNNDDWLKNLNYIAFLRDYGRHFSVNRMMSMDSVKLRLEREQNLSFLEFNYMILQAYDFVELNKRYDCRLQIGGSDQWGNIVNGVELSRRVKGISGIASFPSGEVTGVAYHASKDLFGLTTPLITTSSGAKMGKTASGAVWLNANMCSPYDYWQYWRNTEDADVERFLKFFTELSLEEIKTLVSDTSGAGINNAKKVLANEATKLCHGDAAALEAAETARKTFEEGGLGGSLPEITLEKAQLDTDLADVREIMVRLSFAESKGDAKKLIAGGGVKLNDQAVTDAARKLTAADFIGGAAKLSKGKKHHAKIVLKE